MVAFYSQHMPGVCLFKNVNTSISMQSAVPDFVYLFNCVTNLGHRYFKKKTTIINCNNVFQNSYFPVPKKGTNLCKKLIPDVLIHIPEPLLFLEFPFFSQWSWSLFSGAQQGWWMQCHQFYGLFIFQES